MKHDSNNLFFIIILALSLLLFSSSFSLFFTNDDFFHLLISKPADIRNFLLSFDITYPHQGYPHFRPLTTQFFYLAAWLFGLNPLPMRILLFINYLVVCFLVYILFKELGLSDKSSRLGLLLYTVSATHFGRIYFLSTQEFGYSLFVLLLIILFMKFIENKNAFYYYGAFFTYFLSILSKEKALVTPFLIGISLLYFEFNKYKVLNIKIIFVSFKILIIKLIPFLLLSLIYLYFRIFKYGLASGDSYIWDFSLRFINTYFWYGLWSLNLPEMLVDFVGPGLRINANLFKFWSGYVIPIFILFSFQIIIFLTSVIKSRKTFKGLIPDYIFGFLWFMVTLLPVVFLPLHKFSFYTTLSLMGLIFIIVKTLENKDNKITVVFCILWILTSFINLKLTEETHWITRGSKTAYLVNEYFAKNENELSGYKKLVFVDSQEDQKLPWKPSEIVKSSLSDQNYFKVFYPGKIDVYYGNDFIDNSTYNIKARQFIGY